MNNELVSILIPVYNRETIVGESIQSALNQSYKNIEIIIVDNNSTDRTWNVIENFANNDNRIKIFKNDINVGPVRNWKRCIDEANGYYVKFLFSDDLISENFIEETLKVFKVNTAFVISKIKIFNDKETLLCILNKEKTLSSDAYLKDVLLKNKNDFPVSPGSAIFRKKDVLGAYIENFDSKYKLDFTKYGAGNDLWFFLKIANGYEEVKINTKAISYFRNHNNSFTISNNLTLHYEIAKYEFIKSYYSKYLSKFKSVLFVNKLKHIGLNVLYKNINAKLDFIYLLNYLKYKALKKLY